MGIRWSFFILFFVFFSPNLFFGQTYHRDLTKEKWTFAQDGKEDWHPALLPGVVHTDLLKNHLIPDPFYSDNESKVQWVENENWNYKTTFYVTEKELQRDHLELVFEGIDTFAKILLNGKEILQTNNAFRTWKVDVRNQLFVGENRLEVKLLSSVKIGKAKAAELSYRLPENERVFVRKPQYQFGWDWGPRLVTSGIWKPVYINSWNTAQIQQVKHRQKIEKNKATLDFGIEINVEKEGDYQLFINQKPKNCYLKKGYNRVPFTYEIKKPKLWWTYDLGLPYLYTFDILLLKDQQKISTFQQKIGLRTIELVQDKDTFGKSFYFKLNGSPIYIKGANTIPLHSFPTEANRNSYEKLVDEALFAKMNMLRVWGGGLYESDDFYRICDEKGILVWQDFPFACAMYPGDEDFMKNVKQEVIDNVNRLQNHPSLAVWCGNNENDEGWHNWGWQKQLGYSKEDSTKIWKDYVQLFRKLIPETIDSVSSQKPIYWQSSPSNGWGRKQAYTEGDVHYWGVWWGMEPFEKYEEKVGRFVSEYGFQGMPSKETFQSFTSNLSFDVSGVKNHQKHKTGYETIRTYMERDFPVPTKFEDFIYVSQLVQARGMEVAIMAHRTSKPYNMGTLYWQLNDVWPVTSWSSVDFYGRRKAAHYVVKKSFEPIVLSVKNEKEAFDFYVINDQLKEEKGELVVRLKDFKGNQLKTWNHLGKAKTDSANRIFSIAKKELLNWNLAQVYFEIEFGIKPSIAKKYFLTSPKDLQLQKPHFTIRKINDHEVEISTDLLAKNVYLDNKFGNLSDNYFDLGAGEKKRISSDSKIEIVEIKSLFDVMGK